MKQRRGVDEYSHHGRIHIVEMGGHAITQRAWQTVPECHLQGTPIVLALTYVCKQKKKFKSFLIFAQTSGAIDGCVDGECREVNCDLHWRAGQN